MSKKIKLSIRRLIATVLYLLDSLLPPTCRLVRPGSYKGKTKMIVFHHIDDADKLTKLIINFSSRYNIITFEDWINGRTSRHHLNIIFSLDDGYLSWIIKGLPVFAKYNIRPLAFVATASLDLDLNQQSLFCLHNLRTWFEPLLSSEDIVVLDQAGWYLGSHTHNHIDFSESDHTSVSMDIETSLAVLESKLCKAPQYFSYPFGITDPSTIPAVEGFSSITYAFTSESNFLEDSKSRLLMPRVNIGLRKPVVANSYLLGYDIYITRLASRIRSFRLSLLELTQLLYVT